MIQIVEILGWSEQGLTHPFICRGGDDNTWFVKGVGAGRRGQACEWIAGELALDPGLSPISHARIYVMRLSREQVAIIRESAERVFGEKAQVWLFGSRVDDNKRGGDIDLLIRPAPGEADNLVRKKIRFLGMLERALGERRIDVIVEHGADPRAVERIALETGIRL